MSNLSNEKDIDIDETSLINPSIITKFKINNGKFDICFDLDAFKLMLEEKEEPVTAIEALGYIGNIFSLAFFATPLIQIIKAYKNN